MIDQLADVALWLRFVIGYPTIVVAGLLLGVLALGKMQTTRNGQRRVYRILMLVAFGLAWIGFWGIMGIVQYGTLLQGVTVSIKPIGLAFSAGIVWLALCLATLTAYLIYSELRCARKTDSREVISST